MCAPVVSGEGLGAEIAQYKCDKFAEPSAPHIFLTFIAQSRPPDPLGTQFLCNYDILYYSQCTWGYSITVNALTVADRFPDPSGKAAGIAPCLGKGDDWTARPSVKREAYTQPYLRTE